MIKRCQGEEGPELKIVECPDLKRKCSSYEIRYPVEIQPSGPWVEQLPPRDREQLPGYIITVVVRMKDCLTLTGLVYGERIRSVTLTPGESRDVEFERETTRSSETVSSTEQLSQILKSTHDVLASKFEDGVITSDVTSSGVTSTVDGGVSNLGENSFVDNNGIRWTLSNQHYDSAVTSSSFTDLSELRSAVIDMEEQIRMDVDDTATLREIKYEDSTTTTTSDRRRTSRIQHIINPSSLQSIRYDYYRLYEKFSLETSRESLIFETPFAHWRRLPRTKYRTNRALPVREPLAYKLAGQYGGAEGRRFLEESVRIINEEMPSETVTKTFCRRTKSEHVESRLGACLATDEHTIEMMELDRELMEARIKSERSQSESGEENAGGDA